MITPISSIYFCLIGLIFIILGIKTAITRTKTGIMIGDEGNRDLILAMRAQANATEYVPITLLLLFSAELNGATAGLLHGLGVSLIISRIWHAWSFTKFPEKGFGRGGSTSITWLVILSLVILNFYLVVIQ